METNSNEEAGQKDEDSTSATGYINPNTNNDTETVYERPAVSQILVEYIIEYN